MNILKTKHLFASLFLLIGLSALSQTNSSLIPFRKGDLFGYSDTALKIVIPAVYTRADFFHDGMARVCQGDKYGYINMQGELLIPLVYDYNWERPTYFSNGLGLISVKQPYGGYLYGYVNKKGELVQKAELMMAENFYKGTAALKTVTGVDLLVDSNLKVLSNFIRIEPMDVDIPPYKRKDLYKVVCEGGGTGIIKKNGEMLIPCNYTGSGYFQEGVFITSLAREGTYFGQKFSTRMKGAIDIENNLIIPFKYYDIDVFKEGMARVRMQKFGYVNKNGKEVIPCLYDYPEEKDKSDRTYGQLPGFCEGYVKACLDGMCGFLDKKGKVAIPFKYKHVSSFKEGLAKFSVDGKIGFLNKRGKEVIAAKYDEAGHFYSGCAWVKQDGKLGYVNKQGQEIYPLVIEMGPGEMPRNFSEGFMIIRKENKLAFFDAKGKPLTKFIYDDAGDFYQGMARVSIRGLWGMIDTTGKTLIPLLYNNVYNVEEDLIRVKDRRSTGFYNRQGKFIIPAIYELDFLEWQNGFIFTMRHNKKGYYQKSYIDKKGNDYSEDD